MLTPFSIFRGLFEFFEGLLPPVNHNTKHNASFTKVELDSSSMHHECALIFMQPLNDAIRGIKILHYFYFRIVGMRRADHFPIMILSGC